MSPKKTKYTLTLDDRAATMTAEQLECREVNHPWTLVPTPEERRLELAGKKQKEKVRVCTRCGCQRHELYWIPDMHPVRKPTYVHAPGYLIDSARFGGRGRLSKADIRRAQFAREDADLVKKS